MFYVPLGRKNAARETNSPPLVRVTPIAEAKLCAGGLGLHVSGMREMRRIDDHGGDEEVAGMCLQDVIFPTVNKTDRE